MVRNGKNYGHKMEKIMVRNGENYGHKMEKIMVRNGENYGDKMEKNVVKQERHLGVRRADVEELRDGRGRLGMRSGTIVSSDVQQEDPDGH